MCRWGCTTHDTTYMCKWCGTRYCKECLRGDFDGHMREPTICRICFQTRCQGIRVEYVPRKIDPDADKKGKRGKSASRGRSASAKRSKSAGGRKKSGKKSAKKKKR